MNGVMMKRFEQPDETRSMDRGKFEVVRVGDRTIGRATYEPGWKWSEHVGPGLGSARCTVEHVGLVLAGVAAVEFDDGEVLLLQKGELFSIPRALGLTACVLGLRDYVDKSGFTGVVLGLSGGIDSALCAAMAVDALGADRVRCVMLPYRFTSQDSLGKNLSRCL